MEMRNKKRLSAETSQKSSRSSSVNESIKYKPALPMVNGSKSEPSFIIAVWKCILSLKNEGIRTSFGAVKAEMHKEFRQYSKVFDCGLRTAHDEKLVAECKIGGVTVLELPDEEDNRLTHEVNCYNCFLSGEEMWECKSCHRVYHENCFSYSDTKGKCFYCTPHIQEEVRERNLTITDINDLLSIMYCKIGLKNGYMDVIQDSFLAKEESSIKKLLPKLLYRHDFNNSTIQRKLENNEYRSIKECVRDYRQMVYNICVVNGVNSHAAKRAQQMYSFVQSEESYMHNCFDCYVYYARDKRGDKKNIWFLMPCNPPHEIVFAKYKHFEPAPAKVIRSDKDQSFLWFFGDYEVAWVHKENMSPCLTVKEPISHKLKLALIEMEKYKLIINRYKDGKIDFGGIPRIRRRRYVIASDSGSQND